MAYDERKEEMKGIKHKKKENEDLANVTLSLVSRQTSGVKCRGSETIPGLVRRQARVSDWGDGLAQ